MKIIHIYRKCKLITARTRCYSDNHPENEANIFAGGGNEMKMIYIKIRDAEWSEGEKRANCVVNFWFSFTFGSIFNQLNAIGICGTNTVVGKAMMEKIHLKIMHVIYKISWQLNAGARCALERSHRRRLSGEEAIKSAIVWELDWWKF